MISPSWCGTLDRTLAHIHLQRHPRNHGKPETDILLHTETAFDFVNQFALCNCLLWIKLPKSVWLYSKHFSATSKVQREPAVRFLFVCRYHRPTAIIHHSICLLPFYQSRKSCIKASVVAWNSSLVIGLWISIVINIILLVDDPSWPARQWSHLVWAFSLPRISTTFCIQIGRA